jgi:hypothetical protein
LLQDYDTSYRLLSVVNHGSAGGDIGHRRELHGRSIVRAGPAPSVCPIALRYGHRYFEMLVADSERVAGRAATERLQAILATVDGLLDDHRAVCFALDSQLWPDAVPATGMVLRVELDGQWTWLLLDTEREMTVLATPVGLDGERLRALRDSVAAMEEANTGRTKPIIVDPGPLQGEPVSGAPWKPASTTLGEKRENTRRLQVKTPVRDLSLFDPP